VSCLSNDADTSILGCYYDRKIYIFDVDSDELNGVHQSTLAHELLHAIWERHPDDEIAKELGAVYQKYHDESLDSIILNIRYGRIKCGKKAGLIKVNPKEKIKLEGVLLGKEDK
jgi:hypothetical protein